MKNNSSKIQSFIFGAVSMFIALAVMYAVQAFVMKDYYGPLSIWRFKWYFIGPLFILFGIQVGLLHMIRSRGRSAHAIVAASGGASGTAMVGCCLHNLVYFIPFLGFPGMAQFLSLYQDYLFAISLLFAIGGTVYLLKKMKKHPVCCGGA